jgi:hypothetical protein
LLSAFRRALVVMLTLGLYGTLLLVVAAGSALSAAGLGARAGESQTVFLAAVGVVGALLLTLAGREWWRSRGGRA